MVKVFFSILFFLVLIPVFGQGHRAGTEAIRMLEGAQAYAENYQNVSSVFLCNDFYRKPLGNSPDTLKAGDLLTSTYFETRLITKLDKNIYRFKIISLSSREESDAEETVDQMLQEMKSGKSFNEVYQKYMPIPPKSELETGDVGWMDADAYNRTFSEAIKSARKGDIFVIHDTIQGWHNLIWMTHDSKRVSGFSALVYQNSEAMSLPMQRVDVEQEIRSLKSAESLVAYAKDNPEEVSLELISESSAYLFSEISKRSDSKRGGEGVYFDDYEKRYRWIKDTSVVLYSFNYIYFSGDKLSKKDKDAAIKDVYNKFNKGVPFDEIIAEYWPDNNGRSNLSEIDGGLLDPDFVAKLQTTGIGELFVARVIQSYFIGVPYKEPRTEKAFLVLSY